jgi:glutamate/tyrosine decarboxylase-like PLP-dependent enzyme
MDQVSFNLDATERARLGQVVFEQIETFYSSTRALSVTPKLEVSAIRELVEQLELKDGHDPVQVIEEVVSGLREYAVHTPHQRYYGLFNPRANFPSILADLLVAAFNPQLAAWSHAPFAAEVERHLVREIGGKFGYDTDSVDGVFATGGAEANLTAVLCALSDAFPNIHSSGLLQIPSRPLIYCSAESHHSIARAARVAGLGEKSVVTVPADESLRLDVDALRLRIHADQQAGHTPLMVVGTAGTTGAGTIDPLHEIADVAGQHGLWFHADAAYGGGAMLSTTLRDHFGGIERADSITFDAHKWMSVPMGASLFLTSHPNILSQTFALRADYMPNDTDELQVVDPFSHSIQWSRRFIGLKVWMSLRVFGWKGYDEVITRQARMGDRLRQRLKDHGWSIENETPLPVVCFTDVEVGSNPEFARAVLEGVLGSGRAWISTYPIGDQLTLRACITNYDTQDEDIEQLLESLNAARAQWGSEPRVARGCRE